MNTLRSCIVSLFNGGHWFFFRRLFVYSFYISTQLFLFATVSNTNTNHNLCFEVKFFFSPFNILIIRSLSFAVCQNQILQITEACGVLIRYILNKFEKSSNSDTKILLHALKSLCEGKSQDQDFDQIVFSSILRNAKYPEHKSNVTGWSQICNIFY